MIGDDWTKPHELAALTEWAKGLGGLCVEFGTWTGRSAEAILKGLDQGGQGTLFCVDHFKGPKTVDVKAYGDFSPEAIEAECRKRLEFWLTPEDYHSTCIIIKRSMADARELLETQMTSMVSMVFIDGEHSYEACKYDVDTAKMLVKPGGIICGHDFQYPGVRKAVLEAFGSRVVLTGPGSLWRMKCLC